GGLEKTTARIRVTARRVLTLHDIGWRCGELKKNLVTPKARPEPPRRLSTNGNKLRYRIDNSIRPEHVEGSVTILYRPGKRCLLYPLIRNEGSTRTGGE